MGVPSLSSYRSQSQQAPFPGFWGTKQGKIRQTWKRRWFVFDGTSLNYKVSDSENGKVKGSILLASIKSVQPVQSVRKKKKKGKSTANKPGLKIHTTKRIWLIEFENAETRDDLVTELARLGYS